MMYEASDWRRGALELADLLDGAPEIDAAVWNEFQGIVGLWQSEQRVMFAALPACEPSSMAAYLRDITR